VKGELHFPIEDLLVPEDAFSALTADVSTGITLDQGAKCGRCHDDEAPAADYPFRGAFTSAIVKPAPFFAVDVAAIRQEHDTCDPAAEPERCALLQSLFDHGDAAQTLFP
jgi:hypothetical protein